MVGIKSREGIRKASHQLEGDIKKLLREYTASQLISTIHTIKKEEKRQQQLTNIPVSVFYGIKAGCFEHLVKYCIEVCKFRKRDIAQLLKRDQRTIWKAYAEAIRKSPTPSDLSNNKITIPLSIFSQREFSVLELLSHYLHEQYQMPNRKIAVLLGRSEKTIWTVLNRFRKKEAS